MNDLQMYEWIQKMKEGDKNAFQSLYESTYKDVYRTIVFLVFDKQDVEDIMNEVYIQMWSSIHNYDPNRPFKFWLHGLIVRQVQNWKRKIWRLTRIFEREKSMVQEDFEWIDKNILQIETSEEVMYMIKGLSEKLRIVIILRYFNDYSIDEIAKILEIPLGTVKSRHHLALKTLQKKAKDIPIEKGGKLNAY